jgi:radical SAM protein with 4Fe4S-binding SPASM domain
MADPRLHRFELDGRHFALDPETCFCFECDGVSWDVLEHYPHTTVTRIIHLLEGRHPAKEVEEVVGELEWLRSCGSILPVSSQATQSKAFELERGLKQLVLRWTDEDGPKYFQESLGLLLGRSETQKEVLLVALCVDALPDADTWAACGEEAFRQARLAGRTLTLALRLEDPPWKKEPTPLKGHALSIEASVGNEAHIEEAHVLLSDVSNASLGRFAKTLPEAPEEVQLKVVLRPGHAAFSDASATLEKLGFRHIELDLDGAHASGALDSAQAADELAKVAQFYAERLRGHHYFRLDPLAELFWRIYQGKAMHRADPAGVNRLAVDASGRIFPATLFFEQDEFVCGSLEEGELREAALAPFEDLGSMTTTACIRCWARRLCGGGKAAVHQRLSGNFRRPHPSWCDAQRAWLEKAVSAFSGLSEEGVNFNRVYHALGNVKRPSLFQLARTALRMQVGLRPIEEQDATWLTQWENWNEAAYFLFNESGVFLATCYDREMDSVHPRGYEHELVLVRKTGKPFGLLKIRPEHTQGTALAWIYFRDSKDYGVESVRTSFRRILNELAGQQTLRKLMIPVGPSDEGLADFLKGLDFQSGGVLREALFQHGAYHDVEVFTASLEACGQGDQ